MPTAPVVADSNTLSVKEQKQLKRMKVLQDKQLADYIPGGAAGTVPSKKQLKAAMQLKRQQQQQGAATGSNAVSTSTNPAGVNPASAGGVNSATATTPSAAVGGKAPAALESKYSTPTIEQAMRVYHAQSTKDLSRVVPYIPTYTAASAAQ